MKDEPLDILVTLALATYLCNKDNVDSAVKRLARTYKERLPYNATGTKRMLRHIIKHDKPVQVVRLSYSKLMDMKKAGLINEFNTQTRTL